MKFDKELAMELLEKLMQEMDDVSAKRVSSKVKPEEEPMAVVEEKSIVPLEEADDLLEDKIEQAMSMDVEASEEEDYGSSLVKKLNEKRKLKALKE